MATIKRMLGTTVTVQCRYENSAGQLTDPTTSVITAERSDDSSAPVTNVQNPSVGIHTGDVITADSDPPGIWRGQCDGSGNGVDVVDETMFCMVPQEVT